MSRQSFKAALFLVIAATCLSFAGATAGAQEQNQFSQESATLSPATTLYSQPPSASGGLFQSSWWDPNGSDYDQYLWDGFVLLGNETITEVHWRGGYDPAKFGYGGAVVDFTVAIYASIPGGSQPNILTSLVQYQTGGNAGETLAGTFGGASMYDYAFTLPVPFKAVAGTRYWLQIKASQNGIPDWGLAAATGGDGKYYRCMAGSVGDKIYQLVSGDAAFTLLSSTPSLRVSSNGTNDGWVLELSEASGIGGSFDASATTFRLGDDGANRQYRAILSFNSGRLPATAVIQSAVLKIKRSGLPTGSNPFTVLGNLVVDIRKGAFGGVGALAASDFEATASAANVATFSPLPVGGWYSATLNAAGMKRINRTGLTQFRLRFDLPTDSNNQADFMKFLSGNATTGKPVLVVAYSMP